MQAHDIHDKSSRQMHLTYRMDTLKVIILLFNICIFSDFISADYGGAVGDM